MFSRWPQGYTFEKSRTQISVFVTPTVHYSSTAREEKVRGSQRNLSKSVPVSRKHCRRKLWGQSVKTYGPVQSQHLPMPPCYILPGGKELRSRLVHLSEPQLILALPALWVEWERSEGKFKGTPAPSHCHSRECSWRGCGWDAGILPSWEAWFW